MQADDTTAAPSHVDGAAPRGLLGLAALFWGFCTEQAVLGLLAAVLVEAPFFMSWRFAVASKDFYRVADLTSVAFIVIAVYQVNNRALTGIFALLALAPSFVLPLLLTQLFSSAPGTPTSALFLSLRRRMRATDFQGEQYADLRLPFFFVCLVAAASTQRAEVVYFAGCCLLLAMFLFLGRSRRFHAALWAAALALGIGLGWSGQVGLIYTERFMERFMMSMFDEWHTARTNPNRARTAIGQLGRLKLGNSIRIRVKPDSPLEQPLYLFEAAYVDYRTSNWLARGETHVDIDASADNRWNLVDGEERIRHFTLTMNRKREVEVLPRPHNTKTLYGDVFSVSRNALGAIEVETPTGFVDVQVETQADIGAAMPEPGLADLEVHASYQPIMHDLLLESGLPAPAIGEPAPTPPDPESVVAVLTEFFAANFKYSLVQRRAGYPWFKPLNTFLTDTRAGHCEYFATATVLALRAAGIPARYAVGYLVTERSNLEQAYVARARDAHAWVLAWYDGNWQVVDTTPSTWRELEDSAAPAWQGLLDLWSWLKLRLAMIQEDDELIGRVGTWVLPVLIVILAWRLRQYRRVQTEVPDASTRGDETRGGFTAVITRFTAAGYPPRAGEPLGAWLSRLGRIEVIAKQANEAARILPLYYRSRFDPNGISSDDQSELRAVMERLARP